MRLRCWSMPRCKVRHVLPCHPRLSLDRRIGVGHFGRATAAHRVELGLRPDIFRMVMVIALRDLGKLLPWCAQLGF